MSVQKVAFAVACNKEQAPAWWRTLIDEVVLAVQDPEIEWKGTIIQGSAAPDFNKNNLTVEVFGKRLFLTDVNRNDIVDQALEQDVDWVYWWDDDTTHPAGTLQQLLKLGSPFVSGVYHMKNEPYPAIAYYKNPDNPTSRNLVNYRRGALVEVDWVGMGCALIHRRVYEAIRDAHTVYWTDRRTLVVVPNDRTNLDGQVTLPDGVASGVVGEHFVQTVRPAPMEELYKSQSQWPFYGMEVTRTEDVWFCELAANVGIKPLVDTGIQCGHLGLRSFGRQNHRRYKLYARAEPVEEVTDAAHE